MYYPEVKGSAQDVLHLERNNSASVNHVSLCTDKIICVWLVIPRARGTVHGVLQHFFAWHPSKLWQLKKACWLALGECGLNGSLPIKLGNLVNLVMLFLQLNSFTGAILF
jgi:hypothetical protein